MGALNVVIMTFSMWTGEASLTEARSKGISFVPMEQVNDYRLHKLKVGGDLVWEKGDELYKFDSDVLQFRTGNEIGDELYKELSQPETERENRNPYLFFKYQQTVASWKLRLQFDQPDHFSDWSVGYRGQRLNEALSLWENRAWFGENIPFYSKIATEAEYEEGQAKSLFQGVSRWFWHQNTPSFHLTPYREDKARISQNWDRWCGQLEISQLHLGLNHFDSSPQSRYHIGFGYDTGTWAFGLKSFTWNDEDTYRNYAGVYSKGNIEKGYDYIRWLFDAEMEKQQGLFQIRKSFGDYVWHQFLEIEWSQKIYNPAFLNREDLTMVTTGFDEKREWSNRLKLGYGWKGTPLYRVYYETQVAGGRLRGEELWVTDSLWKESVRWIRKSTYSFEDKWRPFVSWNLELKQQYRQVLENEFTAKYYKELVEGENYVSPEWQLKYDFRILLPSQLRIVSSVKWHSDYSLKGYSVAKENDYKGRSDWTWDLSLIQYFLNRKLVLEGHFMDLLASNEQESPNGDEHRFRVIVGGKWLF